MKLKVLSFGIMALGLAVMGCSSKASAQKEADDQSGTFKFVNYSAEEKGITKNTMYEKEIILSLSVDAPVGNSVADKAITKWIREEIINSVSQGEEREAIINSVPLDIPIDQAMISNIAKAGISNFYDSSFIEFICDTVTDKFITYSHCEEHGFGPYIDKVTFTADSGKILTYKDVLPKANSEKFIKLVYKIDEEENDRKLKPEWTDRAQDWQVVFGQEGIEMVLGTCRLDEETVIVPYDQLRDIFTPEAVALFPAESEETKLKNERKELLKKRVLEIYRDKDYENKEAKYCSEIYLKVFTPVNKKDKQMLSTGEGIGFFDYDHWTNSQDELENPKFEIKTLKMTSPTEAIVEIRENQWGTGAELKMVWERDNWYVDDFLRSDGYGNEVERMKEYLKENGISY